MFQGDFMKRFFFILGLVLYSFFLKACIYSDFIFLANSDVYISKPNLALDLSLLSELTILFSFFLCKKNLSKKSVLLVILSIVAVDIFMFFFYLIMSFGNYGLFVALNVLFWQLSTCLFCVLLILCLYVHLFLFTSRRD